MSNLFSDNYYYNTTLLFFATHLLSYWSLSFLFFLLDLCTNIKYKYSLRDDKYIPIDWILYKKAFTYVLCIQLFILLPFLYYSSLLYTFGFEENVIDYIIKLSKAVLCEEIMFYYSHRLLHTRLFWKFHSLHHQLITSVAVGTMHSSIFENLLCNFIPVAVSTYLCDMSLELTLCWICMTTSSAVFSHCGFTFLKSLTEFHSTHHLNKSSNFGVLGLLDFIHGTKV